MASSPTIAYESTIVDPISVVGIGICNDPFSSEQLWALKYGRVITLSTNLTTSMIMNW